MVVRGAPAIGITAAYGMGIAQVDRERERFIIGGEKENENEE